MTLCFQETSDKIIVSFTEATILDEARIQEVGSGILGLCKRAVSTTKRMVFDFGGVRFLTSAMIGELVLLNKATKQQSLDIRAVNLSPNVHEVLKITRLHKVFRNDDDDPGFLGTGVPNPKPPNTFNGGAEPPSV